MVAVVLGGCESTPTREQAAAPVSLLQAQGELSDAALLDVGIEVFDPGLPSAGESSQEAASSPEIRRAESRFMPVHLRHTLERSGHWGAVRVVPPGADNLDVFVRGQLQESDGQRLVVRIDAYDASGRRWFSKVYKTEIQARAYAGNQRGVKDAFQDGYNTIANDLAQFRAELAAEQVRDIRRIAELRFAADLAPEVFQSHLAHTREGYLEVNRLPAHDDPMFARVQRIRARDSLLIDTLNGQYESFYADMWDPYENWRKFRSEEAAALRAVEREATKRKALGVAAIAGAIALGVLGNRSKCTTSGGTTSCSGVNLSGLSTAAALGGAALLKSGFDKSAETAIHKDAIQELGISFESEVAPLVVEVEGETIELTGSAEAQYANWRQLLRKIHRSETGLGGVTQSESDAGPAEQPAPSY